MSAVAVTIPDAMVDLETRYELWEPDEVRAFLVANPDILASLDEVAAHITRYFHLHRPLILAVPDDGQDGGRDTLFVYIPTKLAPEDALALRNQMFEEWWVEAARQWDVRLEIDVRYL